MANGYSLHIGLNSINPESYFGFDGQLIACENDARSMGKIAKLLKYKKVKKLLTQKATKQNFIDLMNLFAKEVQEGDIFLLSFSGHGDQVRDNNNDEIDKQDEMWYLYDGKIIDDEIHALLCGFKQNTRILVVSDSCFSGTITQLISFDVIKANLPDNTKTNLENMFLKFKNTPSKAFMTEFQEKDAFVDSSLLNTSNAKKSNIEVRATVKLFSGCQENQIAKDGKKNSVFSEKIIQVWDNGAFQGNYLDFYNEILLIMPNISTQKPNLNVIGIENILFDAQKPFTV